MTERLDDLVIMGRVSGLFGVRGWVKVFSYSDPRENIVKYNPWYIKIRGAWQKMQVAEGQRHGKGVVARLEDFTDRDAASTLIGADIALSRDQLPDLEPDEYYWSELEGLKVFNQDGKDLGIVDHLIETGSNDVLVVKGERERLIPFIRKEVVINVDLKGGILHVDWDPDF